MLKYRPAPKHFDKDAYPCPHPLVTLSKESSFRIHSMNWKCRGSQGILPKRRKRRGKEKPKRLTHPEPENHLHKPPRENQPVPHRLSPFPTGNGDHVRLPLQDPFTPSSCYRARRRSPEPPTASHDPEKERDPPEHRAAPPPHRLRLFEPDRGAQVRDCEQSRQQSRERGGRVRRAEEGGGWLRQVHGFAEEEDEVLVGEVGGGVQEVVCDRQEGGGVNPDEGLGREEGCHSFLVFVFWLYFWRGDRNF